MQNLMILFDLDGTIWDAAQEVADSWSTVMRRYFPDLPVLTAQDINAVMGQTMDDIARNLFADMDPEKRKRLFQECEDYELRYIAERGGRLYPGVEETLRKLRDAGFLMGIVSNCQKGYIDAFYQSMKLKAYFCDMEEWGNTGKSKAENIRLVMQRNQFENAVYIGDTLRDQQAADAAGIPFIHASYGFGEAKNPEGTVRSFSEIPACIERLFC